MGQILNFIQKSLNDAKPTEVEERKTTLGIARIVFNEDTDFKITKTWVAEVQNTSILVPKHVREDTTGRKHLTNDVQSGEMYNAGILLKEPVENEWVSATWRRENTVKFRAYITTNNRITIPAQIRNKYNIQDNDTIQIALTDRVFESSKPSESHVPDWMYI